MEMPYTNNPNLPQVRMEAFRLINYEHWGIRQVARHLGFSHCTVRLWAKRAPALGYRGHLIILARSSRPHHHPKALPSEMISRVLTLRAERQECAEVLHHRLSSEGLKISLSSVKRILKRHHLSRFSEWKKWHQYPPRPKAEKPGLLVQIDSMHDGPTH